MSRKCRCGRWFPDDEFISPGARARCKSCREKANAENRARRELAGPMLARSEHLWSTYRMRLADYNELRAQQDYRCKICGAHEDEIPIALKGRPRKDGKPSADPHKLVVDHCHTTGRVRGLLCNACNTMLGNAREQPDVLRAGADYLTRESSFIPSVQPLFDIGGSPAA